MKTLRTKLSGAWLVVIGVAIAGLLTPAVAVATGQLVQISSPSGRTAQVTKANQLQSAEFGPDRIRAVHSSVTPTVTCQSMLSASSTSTTGFVVKSVYINVKSFSGTPTVSLGVSSSACSFFPDVMVDVTTRGVISVPIEPGIVVLPGQEVTLQGLGNVTATAFLRFYEVPASALGS
jgi:hypothetical protein